MSRLLFSMLALLLVGAIGVPLYAWLVAADAEPVEPAKTQLRTVYLPSAVKVNAGQYHRINVEFTLDKDSGSGRIVLDQNGCGINRFGDTDVCTLIAPISIPVTLTKVDQDDPLKNKRALYRLTGEGLDTPIYLVVPKALDPVVLPAANQRNTVIVEVLQPASYRLVIGEEKEAVVVTLESPLEPPPMRAMP